MNPTQKTPCVFQDKLSLFVDAPFSNRPPTDWYSANGKSSSPTPDSFPFLSCEWLLPLLPSHEAILRDCTKSTFQREYIDLIPTPFATSLTFPVEVNHHPHCD